MPNTQDPVYLAEQIEQRDRAIKYLKNVKERAIPIFIEELIDRMSNPWICDTDPQSLADIFLTILQDPSIQSKFGPKHGKRRKI